MCLQWNTEGNNFLFTPGGKDHDSMDDWMMKAEMITRVIPKRGYLLSLLRVSNSPAGAKRVVHTLYS